MAVDDCFEIGGEAGIERGGRAALLCQAKRFRKAPQRALLGNPEHKGRGTAVFNNYLNSCTGTRRQCSKVTDRLSFRNVDGRHVNDDTANAGLQRGGDHAGNEVVIVGFGNLGLVEVAGLERLKLAKVVDVDFAVDFGGVELGAALPE